MSRPPVTVAIPTYEPGDGLRNALSSVADQEYDGRVTAVVVDNTETASGESIVEEFSFASYHWQLAQFPRQETGMANLAIARDLGVQHASGDYVHFLDDTDELEPTSVARKIDAIDSHPAARGAYSAIRKADGTVKHVPRIVVANPLEFILTNLRPPTLPSALLVDREVLLDCPPRRTLPHEDIAGLIEILLRTPLAYVDEPLMNRTKPPGISNTDVSQAGRVATHERYAGLRAQLLDGQLQQHAETACRQLHRELEQSSEQ